MRRGPSPVTVRRLALASLFANVMIVITGGAVRLTGSGLGCPTWPRCTDDSYVTSPESGIHGLIEFGNRALGMIVGLVMVATFLAVLLAKPRRRSLLALVTVAALGVGVQGLIGGLSVRVNLNPWVVAGHFLTSMALIACVFMLWRRAGEPDTPVRHDVARELRWLALAIATTGGAVLAMGTIVTGSGPHAGDADSPRLGFDPETVSQLHADGVFLLLGLSVAMWLALRAVAAPRRAQRAASVLVLVELAQGLVGFVQYLTDLPVALVALHMAGACAVWLAVMNLVYAIRTRDVPDTTSERRPEAQAVALPV